ncbi:MAG: GNAT family N-acetyltransferase [Balneolaceae bacterium]
MKFKIELIRSDDQNPPGFSREELAEFLFEHLDEFGDSREAILNCIGYAYGDRPGQGGFVLAAHRDGNILGVSIVNDTNMSGYIPEHILVYIAVHSGARGAGLGKALMERTIEETEGEIALHVEPNNPAKYLYKKYGFTNKYLEMRLAK